MKPFVFSILLLALAGTGLPAAAGRMQGSFHLSPGSGAATLKVPGADGVSLGPDAEARFTGAVLNVQIPGETSIRLQASNGVLMAVEGPGEFSVERFVQESWSGELPPYVEADVEPTTSRMILNLRRGRLLFDGSRQSVDSRLGVETPVGSIASGPAVWSIEIVYDPRNRIYNFSVKLKGGELKFTDRRGRSYSLYQGQQLNGVGSSGSPAIEIGEMEDTGLEIFEVLDEQKQLALEENLNWSDFAAKMIPLEEAAVAEEISTGALISDEGRRPITIDIVPRVPESTPFRAVIRPPSAYEEQLF